MPTRALEQHHTQLFFQPSDLSAKRGLGQFQFTRSARKRAFFDSYKKGAGLVPALAFLLAAAHPDQVEAVLAFSPGEYLRKTPGAVAKAAAKVKAPVFIMTPTKEKVRDEGAPEGALVDASIAVSVLDQILQTKVFTRKSPAAQSCISTESKL